MTVVIEWDDLPEFLGTQPENFEITRIRLQFLQQLKRYRVRYLNLSCNYVPLTTDDLVLEDLIELTLREAIQTSFDFLAKAPHLRSLTITGWHHMPDVILNAFHSWNNTLEPEHRFQVDVRDGCMTCERQPR